MEHLPLKCICGYQKKIDRLEQENELLREQLRQLETERDQWAKWGEHVFTCPNKGINPCRDCVSPATADAMSRVDKGGAWWMTL